MWFERAPLVELVEGGDYFAFYHKVAALICDIQQKLLNIAFELATERGKDEKL